MASPRRPQATWRPISTQEGAYSRSLCSYTFFETNSDDGGPPTVFPEFANVASWYSDFEGYADNILGVVQTTLPSGAPFPEGAALKYWLGNVGALTSNTGGLTVPSATARADAIVTTSNLATPWVRARSDHISREHAVLLVGHAVQRAGERRGAAAVLRAGGL